MAVLGLSISSTNFNKVGAKHFMPDEDVADESTFSVDDEDPDNAGRYYKIYLYFWLLY